jgi:hypothetical protein
VLSGTNPFDGEENFRRTHCEKIGVIQKYIASVWTTAQQMAFLPASISATLGTLKAQSNGA